MKYNKPPLTYDKQADLLISRGLQADREELIEKLKAVNYYRLSGYLYPFRNQDDTFRQETTLGEVWHRYTFDRQLRLLVLDAIERVEVAVRTSLTYHHSHSFGAFGYTAEIYLPNLSKNDFTFLQGKLKTATMQSREAFVGHFKSKYGDTHSVLPLWMLAEIMPFGAMLTFYRGSERKIKKMVSSEFGVAFGVLESWLGSLNVIRNICAHHGRLWNRAFGVKPLIPEKDLQWHSPVEIRNDRVFGTLTILKYMLSYTAPQSKWDKRLMALLGKYPEIPTLQMGFPENWKECAIWK
jgi:abortive infection bacteriophage resistance protein